jgi:hypothetical protein
MSQRDAVLAAGIACRLQDPHVAEARDLIEKEQSALPFIAAITIIDRIEE